MPSVVQPPMASTMSDGHSTARRRSLRLWRKEWITHPSDSRGLSHLLRAALAELALHFCLLQYFGKANSFLWALVSFAAHRDAPTKGMDLVLEEVFSLRHGCSIKLIWGISASKTISEESRPQASESLIPVSLISAINHLGSSFRLRHSSYQPLMKSCVQLHEQRPCLSCHLKDAHRMRQLQTSKVHSVLQAGIF